ncbi:hypothetical protein NIM72_20845 [Pantoea sp. B550]|uniref:hypothetical protein n=1 Tax=Pantoea TaxID=53335 RepID=UPI001CA442A9|nr:MULTISPECIES: hypothetical protein [Pantoea]MCP1207950.1 hypothetical protein [Pantoea sp. B550]MCT2417228.1 hypothetical protein [Pantoea sp. XY16]QZX94122.1 hypothetical protein K6R05_09930 [Pantoea alfalfae]WIL40419.1 hypothetical protein QPJ96_10210 [Pantoea agglomerans]
MLTPISLCLHPSMLDALLLQKMDSSLAVNREKIQRETVYPGTPKPYPMRQLFHLVHLCFSFQASDNENTLSAAGDAADVACHFAAAAAGSRQ